MESQLYSVAHKEESLQKDKRRIKAVDPVTRHRYGRVRDSFEATGSQYGILNRIENPNIAWDRWLLAVSCERIRSLKVSPGYVYFVYSL